MKVEPAPIALSGTLYFLRRRAHLPELLEHRGVIFRRDADTGVDHGDFDVRRDEPGAHFDASAFRRELERVRQQVEQGLATRWRLVSPASATRDAFDALAGTGPERYRAFAAAVGRHRGALASEALSRFAFREPPMSPIVGSVGMSLGALHGAGGVVGVAAMCALRREG